MIAKAIKLGEICAVVSRANPKRYSLGLGATLKKLS